MTNAMERVVVHHHDEARLKDVKPCGHACRCAFPTTGGCQTCARLRHMKAPFADLRKVYPRK